MENNSSLQRWSQGRIAAAVGTLALLGIGAAFVTFAPRWLGGSSSAPRGPVESLVAEGKASGGTAPVAPDPRDLFGWFAVNKDKWFTRVSNDNTSAVVGPAMITTLTGSWTFNSFKGAIGGFRLEGGCFYLLEGNSLCAEAGGCICSGFVLSKTSMSGYVGPNW